MGTSFSLIPVTMYLSLVQHTLAPGSSCSSETSGTGDEKKEDCSGAGVSGILFSWHCNNYPFTQSYHAED